MNNQTKLLAITSLALFFLAGVFAGIIVDRKLLSPIGIEGRVGPPGMQEGMPGGNPQNGPQGGPPEAVAKRVRQDFLNRLTNGLSLTDDQVTKITAMLDDNEAQFKKLREQMRDGLSDLDYNLFNKISTVLDEKQKKKLISEWMSPFHPAGQGGPGGPQGGQPGAPPQGGMMPGGPPPGQGGQMGGDQIPPQVAPGALAPQQGAPGGDRMQQQRLNFPGRQNPPGCVPAPGPRPGGNMPPQGAPPQGAPQGR